MMQGKIQVLILPTVSELLSGYMCNEVKAWVDVMQISGTILFSSKIYLFTK